MAPPSSPPTRYGLLKGVAAGAGIGLLTCDFIDLMGNDHFALVGWFNGITNCTLIGGIVGVLRERKLQKAKETPPAKLWPWFALGGGIFYEGLVIGLYFRHHHGEMWHAWTTTMLIAGVVYLLVPSTIWLIRKAREHRCPGRNSPTTKSS